MKSDTDGEVETDKFAFMHVHYQPILQLWCNVYITHVHWSSAIIVGQLYFGS